MLEVRSVDAHYNKVQALRGVDITVGAGQIVALLGANGAGKSTVLRTISGIVQASGGRITYSGEDITRFSAERIARLGIAHVPEGRGVFPEFNVRENLLVGTLMRRRVGNIGKDYERVYQYFPILHERGGQLASTLSGGEQQMLAIARALLTRPKLLMVDEPSLGLAPKMVAEVMEILRRINREGVTVLLVEQNAAMALRVADAAYVLETGRIVEEGEATQLLQSERVLRSYLGGQWQRQRPS